MGLRVAPFGLVCVLALTIACGRGSLGQIGEAEAPGADSGRAGSGAQEDRPTFSTSGWKTDFSKHSIPLSEISSGGPPKDGIPPIDSPKFLEASGPVDWLKDNEPVIVLVMNREAKAYPLQVLIWHEIVNDTIGGVPVTVTFCPLCNTAIAFKRQLNGITYDFGTTGNLRHSDLVMYDRLTESWWQQITGEAIIGQLTGRQLEALPAAIISWKDFKNAYPKGKVLSRDTGFIRSYGSNPYEGYDNINSAPFLFRSSPDKRLPPMERVVTVSLGGRDVAYPFSLLQKQGVIQHRVAESDLAVFWSTGTASALDRSSITDSRDIGATGVFKATLEGRPLTFQPEGAGRFVDRETESSWNIAGQATTGPLAGKELEPILHGNHFWFAWAVFKPQTHIYQP